MLAGIIVIVHCLSSSAIKSCSSFTRNASSAPILHPSDCQKASDPTIYDVKDLPSIRGLPRSASSSNFLDHHLRRPAVHILHAVALQIPHIPRVAAPTPISWPRYPGTRSTTSPGLGQTIEYRVAVVSNLKTNAQKTNSFRSSPAHPVVSHLSPAHLDDALAIACYDDITAQDHVRD
ncbi:hypothetical protein BD626DRAFT_167332 [Schizophyllum amplum]|uniref:Uncharacterized protein n=1 Tax=Schizophyllum amplum TaxID=97359 RepID=A0A550CQC7_9AGAR|nr:hypothetical protein BD626DRAFT_167332 [Auriculariopsis ampla]